MSKNSFSTMKCWIFISTIPSLPMTVWLFPPSAGVPIDGLTSFTQGRFISSCLKRSCESTSLIVRMFSCRNPIGASARCFICITIIKAQASMVMVMTFCTTMNTRLNTIFVLWTNVPRTISIGSTLDATTAGMTPDTTPVTSSMATNRPKDNGLNITDISILVLSSSPKLCEKANVKSKANIKASAHSIRLSPTNRIAISLRCAPKSLRAAISRARFPDCATVRLT